MNIGYGTIIRECKIGKDTKIWSHCNLYECTIGKRCKIASYVEIGSGVKIGDDYKIEAYAFIPQGVTLGNGVFIGPHVVFTNDKHPRARDKKWTVQSTLVEDDVSIGANSTILSGITLHKGAMIGAGSVVTSSVPAGAKFYGPKAVNRGSIH